MSSNDPPHRLGRTLAKRWDAVVAVSTVGAAAAYFAPNLLGGNPSAYTPAARWAEGAAGIAIPEASDVDGFAAAEVAAALGQVRSAMIAARLDAPGPESAPRLGPHVVRRCTGHRPAGVRDRDQPRVGVRVRHRRCGARARGVLAPPTLANRPSPRASAENPGSYFEPDHTLDITDTCQAV